MTCTKDILKIFDVNNDPQKRDNNPICGIDEGVPILMSLTVYVDLSRSLKSLHKKCNICHSVNIAVCSQIVFHHIFVYDAVPCDTSADSYISQKLGCDFESQHCIIICSL